MQNPDKPNLVSTAYSIRPDQKEAVARAGVALDRPRSWIVRQAIDLYLRENISDDSMRDVHSVERRAA